MTTGGSGVRSVVHRAAVRALVRFVTSLLTTNSSVGVCLRERSGGDRPLSVLVVGMDRERLPGRTVRGGADVECSAPARADSILLVVVEPLANTTLVVALPRDVGVDLPIVGYQRLGWALEYGGASMLVGATARLLGVPIDHYIGVDPRGFRSMIDAVGGIDLELDHALRDGRTGLDLPAGRQRLDGRRALAFVRSRYQESDGGTLPLGDEGRRRRMRVVVRALEDRLDSPLGTIRAARHLLTASHHVIVDDALITRLRSARNPLALLGLARTCRVQFDELPTRRVRRAAQLRSPFPLHQSTGAAYLEVDRAQARAVLDIVCAQLAGPSGGRQPEAGRHTALRGRRARSP